MADLSLFDPNAAGNPKNNIFGLPFGEKDAKLVLLPVPWEVTVSYKAGTARAPEHLFKASLQIDLHDGTYPDSWRQGYFMRPPEKKILLKSDYLRKEAELYINYISQGENIDNNKFMCKALKEVNEGGQYLNQWVYEQSFDLLKAGKLVGLVGGDHSTPLGFLKAIAEFHPEFGILQIDAHADLRKGYEGFVYSHASIMYNTLEEIPAVKKLVQVGVRDFCDEEWNYIIANPDRINTYFDQDLKEKHFEGQSWKQISDDIVNQLPQKVYLSFDIDGLDPKLCPSTGTPVPGGFEAAQIIFLVKSIIRSGRQLIGFDLTEVGVSSNEWDENVGARVLFQLCHLLTASNS
jgi:agmatinase